MSAGQPAEAPALLEREAPLSQLRAWLDQLVVPGAPGRCLLLQGESGVGKSSLLHAACGQRPPQVDWMAGSCEPLLSPAPLGPLLDMLDELPPSLAAMVRSGRPVEQAMPEWLAWLRKPGRPLALVVDDAQWADGATLDLLRFLGRRVESLRALLVLSYRDDELTPDHPLRMVFAGLPATATLRLQLEPLSARAVALAAHRAGRPAQGLHRLTRGNPFFLAELLRAPAGALPASVRDAVLERARRLAPAARELLDLVSMSPVPLERTVLATMVGEALPGLAECIAIGLLEASGDAIGFVTSWPARQRPRRLASRNAAVPTAACCRPCRTQAPPAAFTTPRAQAWPTRSCSSPPKPPSRPQVLRRTARQPACTNWRAPTAQRGHPPHSTLRCWCTGLNRLS